MNIVLVNLNQQGIKMLPEIDTDALAKGGGLMGVLAAVWYMLRHAGRVDTKEAAIDGTWKALVDELKADISSLKADSAAMKETIKVLEAKVVAAYAEVEQCERDRDEMRIELDAFKRRYGTRKEDDGGSRP